MCVHRLCEERWLECHFHNSVKTVQSKHCNEIHYIVSEWELFFCLIFEFCIGNYVSNYILNGDEESDFSSRMWAVIIKQFSV